jgi:hypothetical protein
MHEAMELQEKFNRRSKKKKTKNQRKTILIINKEMSMIK